MSARRILNSALVTLAALAAACGGGSDVTGPGNGGNPGPVPSASKGTVTITNSAPSGTAIFIRSRACGTSTWGMDLLFVDGNGAGAVMGQGETGTWQFNPGCYDFRITPGDVGLDYLYFNSVQVQAGKTTALTISEFPLEP